MAFPYRKWVWSLRKAKEKKTLTKKPTFKPKSAITRISMICALSVEFRNQQKNDLMAVSNTRTKWMHMNAHSAGMQPPMRYAAEFNPLGIRKRLFGILLREVWFCFLQTMQLTFNDDQFRIRPFLQVFSPFFRSFFSGGFYADDE